MVVNTDNVDLPELNVCQSYRLRPLAASHLALLLFPSTLRHKSLVCTRQRLIAVMNTRRQIHRGTYGTHVYQRFLCCHLWWQTQRSIRGKQILFGGGTLGTINPPVDKVWNIVEWKSRLFRFAQRDHDGPGIPCVRQVQLLRTKSLVIT